MLPYRRGVLRRRKAPLFLFPVVAWFLVLSSLIAMALSFLISALIWTLVSFLPRAGATPMLALLKRFSVTRPPPIISRSILWQTLLQKAKLVPRGQMWLPMSPLICIASRPLVRSSLAILVWKAEQLLLRA